MSSEVTSFPEPYQTALNEIAVARGKNITFEQGGAVVALLSRISWRDAKQIVRELTRMPSIPPNLYGIIRERVEEVEREAKKQLEWRDKWTANEDCLTKEEQFWHSQILAEMKIWYDSGLVGKNPPPYCEPCSIEEWIRLGKPRNFSPIIDHMLAGSIEPYQKTIAGNKTALRDYFARYLSTLKTRREERERERFAKRKQEALERINKTTAGGRD